MGHWTNRIKNPKLIRMIATEAVKFQDKELVNQYAKVIGEFRAKNNFSSIDYVNSGIPELIKEHQNISVRFSNASEYGLEHTYFAATEPPRLDGNNIIIPELYASSINRDNADLQIYSKLLKDNVIIGEVDNAKARVNDAFSKIVCPLYISIALMESKEFSDHEIAGLIFHELGHIYEFFAKITRTMIINGIAEAATDRIMALNDDKQKIKVVNDVEKILNVKFENPENIISEYKKEKICIHIVSGIAQTRINSTGSTAIQNRNWERLADDFAVRCGAGPYVATALFKLHTSSLFVRDLAFRSWTSYTVITAVKIAGLVTLGITNPVAYTLFAVAGILLNDPSEYIYDTPEERFKTIRRGLIEELKFAENKSSKQADETRKRILDEIAVVDNILESVKDKLGVFEFLNSYIKLNGRKERKQLEVQKRLESYLSSDLTVATAKLRGKV